MNVLRPQFPFPRLLVIIALSGGAFGMFPTQALLAQGSEEAVARRIADIATIALDEYAIGVRDGRVVNEAELREARLFLDEAQRASEQLPLEARTRIRSQLRVLLAGVEALRAEGELRGLLAELRAELADALGLTLDPFPNTAPSLAHGARLYGEHCRQCHGDQGAGDGPAAVGLDPPPADLTDRAVLGGTSPLDFFRVINVGVAGTAMPALGERLDLDERWAVALYASTLRHSRAAERLGASAIAEFCPACRVVVSDFTATASLNDDDLAALLASGGWSGDGQPVEAVAYARTAGASEKLGADRFLAVARTVEAAKVMVAEAEGWASEGGRDDAAARALDGYLVFEEVEAVVRVRDGKLAARVERAFTQFRATILADAAAAEIAAARGEVDAALDAALATIGATASAPVLFMQSLIIMLREGLEAILIVGALVAFLTKAGAPERKRDIGQGVLAAVGLSGVTAVGFATLFRAATRHQEALEGITMLLAAAVLFWVSYWLVSKIEVRKWQSFVRDQMQRALGSEGSLALAAVAFLAVYREGFETVLFYAALVSTSDGSVPATGGIVSGIVVGSATLVAVYYAMQRWSVHVPLKPFFAVTSALLYLMAFSFAGQGMAELQSAGMISATPLSWVPAVPLLGIFPTTQTLLIQLVLAAALSAALLWVFWLEPKAVRFRS